jgi:hypothetical protein
MGAYAGEGAVAAAAREAEADVVAVERAEFEWEAAVVDAWPRSGGLERAESSAWAALCRAASSSRSRACSSRRCSRFFRLLKTVVGSDTSGATAG